MDLNLLNRTLEVVDQPGIDTFDPRFAQIASLVEKGEYLQAADDAQALITEGINDIRVIGYFVYGLFMAHGPAALGGIFQSLGRLFSENWDAVGPASNREKHTRTTLLWLIKMLDRKLVYEESKASSLWNEWLASTSGPDIQFALDEWDDLRHALTDRLGSEADALMDGLSKIKKWLQVFQQLVPAQVDEADEFLDDADDDAQAPSEHEEPDDEHARQSAQSAAPITDKLSPVGDPDTVSVEGSYHLRRFLKKLALFETLVADQQFEKAAIVDDDLNTLISTFDPRRYFPKIFSNYSLLRAQHIGEIIPFDGAKMTAEWQAMQQLYEVDPDHFLAVDSPNTFETPLPGAMSPETDGGMPDGEYDDYD